MACEFPVAVKAKLMLTAIHCLLFLHYFPDKSRLVCCLMTTFLQLFQNRNFGGRGKMAQFLHATCPTVAYDNIRVGIAIGYWNQQGLIVHGIGYH